MLRHSNNMNEDADKNIFNADLLFCRKDIICFSGYEWNGTRKTRHKLGQINCFFTAIQRFLRLKISSFQKIIKYIWYASSSNIHNHDHYYTLLYLPIWCLNGRADQTHDNCYWFLHSILPFTFLKKNLSNRHDICIKTGIFCPFCQKADLIHGILSL